MKAREPIPDEVLATLSGILSERLGLCFPRERWAELERSLASACAELGFSDAAACADSLRAAPMTQEQAEILAGHVTVGETYFLRDGGSFEALRHHVIPELLRVSGEQQRPLRFWSAGCCTGEEPYSIAMVLDSALPAERKRHVSILATDINPRFLRKATQGIYSEWSFRAMPGSMRERYFRPTKGGMFAIRSEIRRMVTFSCLNLADNAFPSLTTNTNALDVVFCRNVLMYFAPERVAAVATRLYYALRDRGWLFVSPSEMSQAAFPQFEMVDLDGALAYRKGARRPAQPAAPVGLDDARSSALAATIRTSQVASALEPTAERRHLPAEALLAERSEQVYPLAPAAPTVAAPDLAASLDLARQAADEGRLDDASQWCEKALAADRLEPMPYYLLGIIEFERGQHEAGARALRRALYLEPDFVLAHVAMGNLCVAQGRESAAQRHFGNAIELLGKLPTEAVVPASEGVSVGRMLEIVATLRRGLFPIQTVRT